MGSDKSISITCMNCGAKLPDEWAGSAERDRCPKCGSQLATMSLNIIEEVLEPYDCVRGKIEDKNLSSKKKLKYDFIEGYEIRKLDGRLMKKSRIIDKVNDKYVEKVVDPESGEIVHLCEEPLSEHVGHGSAKLNTPKNS